MAKETKTKEDGGIDLSTCKTTLDEQTGIFKMQCPKDIYQQVSKVTPRKLEFKLLLEQEQ